VTGAGGGSFISSVLGYNQGVILRKTHDPEQPAKFLAGEITRHLKKGQSVLWLVTGGSAIEVAVKTAGLLGDIDLGGLHVALTDERYGPVSHADSNWQQLINAGFKLPGAQLQPVLEGADMPQTTAAYDDYLRNQLDQADFSLGLFGMGADGHCAGILPASPAVGSKDYASSYQGPDFKRITMTPLAIAKLDQAVLYAVGKSKIPALQQLQQSVPLGVMPAQALKRAGELIVYNDYQGDSQ
jgi:6-phosphogluconolactonase/glucosamine-6-phosphate isomerase/deaminase